MDSNPKYKFSSLLIRYISITATCILLYDLIIIYSIFFTKRFPSYTSFDAPFDRSGDIWVAMKNIFFTPEYSLYAFILVVSIFVIDLAFSAFLLVHKKQDTVKRKILNIFIFQVIFLMFILTINLLTTSVIFGSSSYITHKNVQKHLKPNQIIFENVSKIDLNSNILLVSGSSFAAVNVPPNSEQKTFYSAHLYPYVLASEVKNNYKNLLDKQSYVFFQNNIYAQSSQILASTSIPILVQTLLEKTNSQYLLKKPLVAYVFLGGQDFIDKYKNFNYAYTKERVDIVKDLPEIDRVANGFVDPIDSTLFVKVHPGYDLSHYLAIASHEALHYYSRVSNQQDYLPYYIEEGLTEYIRQQAYKEVYGKSDAGITYVGWQNQKDVILYLAEKIPEEKLKYLYFNQAYGKFDNLFSEYFPNSDLNEFKKVSVELANLYDVEKADGNKIKIQLKKILNID